MAEMGLRPDRPHVKCSRVVGEVMGNLHPHGDGAIYDALVRMAQPFSMRVAAGRRARQLRLARQRRPAGGHALHRVPPRRRRDADDRRPRRGRRRLPPDVRRGRDRARGPARGAAQPAGQRRERHRGRHGHQHGAAQPRRGRRRGPPPAHAPEGHPRRPDAVRPRPRPADRRQDRRARGDPRGVRDGPRHLPHPRDDPDREPHAPPARHRRHRAALRRRARAGDREDRRPRAPKKVGGISDITDLTDRTHGLRLVIEIKNGFHPEAVLEELFRLTPMEETFGINNVCLVDGQPRTLGLRELLQVYVDHRLEVVRRRSTYRRTKAQDRLHLLEGLLLALLDIDEVIQVIRTSDDTGRGAGPAAAGVRPQRGAGQLHPRHAAAAAHPALPARGRARARRAGRDDRSTHGDPRRRRPAPPDRVQRARRRRQGALDATAHRAAGVGRPARDGIGGAARGR